MAKVVDAEKLVQDNMQFLQSVLQGRVGRKLPKAARLEFTQSIEAIDRRRSRSDLTLALVGGFSAGKSTLINALLGEEILPSGTIPTTAAGTRIIAGDELSLSLDFEEQVATLDMAREQARELLTRIASHLQSEGAANSEYEGLRRLTLHHPSPWLRRGIDIIDTPGLHAGPEDTEATLRIIREEADACLFLYPVEQAGTIGDFAVIRNHLLQQAGQLAFAITKIDQIEDEDEVEEVLEYLRDRIRDETGIEEPLVFGVSALRALQPDERYDEKMFGEFVETLISFMERNRSVIALERTVHLQRQMLSALGEHVTELRRRTNRERRRLQKLVIEDLDAFIKTEEPKLMKALDEHLERYDQLLNVLVGEAVEEATRVRRQAAAALETGTSAHQLQSIYESSYVQDILPQFQDALNKIQRDAARRLEREANAVVKDAFHDFESDFEKMYNLKAVGHQPIRIAPKLSGQQQLTTLRPRSISSLIASSGQSISTGTGAAAGAAIGTFLLPGLGTLVGAALGAIFAESTATPQEDVKRQIRVRIRTQVDRAVDEVRQWLYEAVTDMKARTRRAIRDTMKQYMQTYADTVGQLVAKHERRRRAVDRDAKAIQETISEIGSRLETIVADIGHIRNMRH